MAALKKLVPEIRGRPVTGSFVIESNVCKVCGKLVPLPVRQSRTAALYGAALAKAANLPPIVPFLHYRI